MATMTIDAEKLKTVRKARKLGRPRLARLTGLTERQIARLEGAAPARADICDGTILRISAVLQVPVEALTGTLPLAEDDLSPASEMPAKGGCSCC
ncbi:MAG: helix-turn-helix transcriptional regulator [Pseudomonadota bacterium]